MNKLGGGSLFIAGIFLVLLGALIQSDILTWLLDILGFVVIVAGIIAGIIGLVKVFSGKKSGASDY
jgi:uncharacterized membrane protein YecN with MAPEG domain